MRVVIQRVARASIDVEDTTVGEITEPGPMVLPGAVRGDGCEQVVTLVRETAELRILEGEHFVTEVGTPILVVSRFILYGDTRKERRPPRSRATPSEQVEPFVNAPVEDLRARSLHTEAGVFGAMTEMSLIGSGPSIVLVKA